MKKKILISLCLALIAVTVLSSVAYALTPSQTTTTAQRNWIAKNWTYYARGYYENNCLAYALGNTTSWIWPWGSSNPTLAQAESYMRGLGYSCYERWVYGPYEPCQVACYGWTSNITHFSKITSGGYCWQDGCGTCRAKWGHCEIFNHSNIDCYTNNVYGPEICMFHK